MLTSIGLAARPVISDLVGDLLACHARIRAFVALAERLVEAPATTPATELSETASRVHRYFTVALPLHALDEDLSIRPRLEAAVPPLSVLRCLEQMSGEHGPLEDVIREVAALWKDVAEDPERLAVHRRPLALAAAELDALFRRHLEPEERIIFPAVRERLSPAIQEEIRVEMRLRRT
jgi:hemerythrin-like domain-containing protein